MKHVWTVQAVGGSGDILGVYSNWYAAMGHLEANLEDLEGKGMITYEELLNGTLWEEDEGTLVAAYKIDNHLVEG